MGIGWGWGINEGTEEKGAQEWRKDKGMRRKATGMTEWGILLLRSLNKTDTLRVGTIIQDTICHSRIQRWIPCLGCDVGEPIESPKRGAIAEVEVGDGVESEAAMFLHVEIMHAKSLQRSFQGFDEITILVPLIRGKEDLRGQKVRWTSLLNIPHPAPFSLIFLARSVSSYV